MKKIKRGAKGKEVGKLQVTLNAAGAKPKLKVDEVFGKLTEAALKKFQKANNLDASGTADEATLFALKLGPKPKTEKKAGGKIVEDTKENLKSLDALAASTKKASAEIQNIIKFLQDGSKRVLARGRDAEETGKKLRPLYGELTLLQNEYDKIKLTQIARATAILHRIKEIEKQCKTITAGFNSRAKAFDKDAQRIADILAASQGVFGPPGNLK